MKRYLETLFRHKYLFLVSLIGVPFIVLAITINMESAFVVNASIWVEPSRILDVKGTIQNSAFTNATPNELEARAISERLQTEAFRQEVMDRTGLTDAILAEEWPNASKLESQLDKIPFLRKLAGPLGMRLPASIEEALTMGLKMIEHSVTVDTQGNNLLVISYEGSEPVLGQKLIKETINLYNETVLDIRTEETNAGIVVITRQLRAQQERVDTAVENMRLFLEVHPPPLPGQQRPPEEEADLRRLEQANRLETALYESALTRRESIQLAGEASTSVRSLTFQVVDPPVAVDGSAAKLRQIVMMGMLGLVLGVMLAVAPIVLLTWRDGTVRTKEDLGKAVPASSNIVEVPLLAAPKNWSRSLLLGIAMGRNPLVDPSK